MPIVYLYIIQLLNVIQPGIVDYAANVMLYDYLRKESSCRVGLD